MFYKLNANMEAVRIDDAHEGFEWKRNHPYKAIVGKTHINGNCISTVFLVIDHGIEPDELELFETMIFGDDEKYSEYCERYATWNEAVVGHQRIVEAVLAGENLNSMEGE